MRKELLVLGAVLSSAICFGQQPGWQHLDKTKDGIMGISADKAYTELLKGKKATPVIVAIIDAGIDTTHEDLKKVLWTNPKEKRNGKDDDKNGYADDLHGWSFLGSAKGNVGYDNLELVRQVRQNQARFEGKDAQAIPASDKAAYELYLKEKAVLSQKLEDARHNLLGLTNFNQLLTRILATINKPNPTATDFEAYQPKDNYETQVKQIVLANLKTQPDFNRFKAEQIDAGFKHFKDEVDYHLNMEFDPRSIVGDDYLNSKQRNYGTSDNQGPDPDHGTHVAGIIGAVRDNQIGVNGIADHVELMAVRAVPDGDERDKDVANAIRYAVDNGAKVINMSFGKEYCQDKKAVDEAVKYAMSKDVLLVHAAGNDNKNLDTIANFPNRIYEDKSGAANAWIEVGASGYKDDETLKAPFSNYGKTTVDLFAPGVAIYSTVPGSKYENHEGTSMAAPVVAGLAALIREYYPKLTAVQVKDILMRSVVKIDHAVNVPYMDTFKSVPFSDLCISGGVVNAYQALQLAEHYKPVNTQL